MKLCKKCNVQVKNTVVIDGKIRNISGRKYCLTCSPFGLHNTRKLHTYKNSNSENIHGLLQLNCTVCNKEYEYNGSVRTGHSKTKCNSCVSNGKRTAVKKKCVEYKGGKCERCGYDKCIKALCFHHLDPTQKEFTLSYSWSLSWERVKNEINKCSLLCLNCHAEVHDELDKKVNK